jgi:hypothetical protein
MLWNMAELQLWLHNEVEVEAEEQLFDLEFNVVHPLR